MGERWTAAGVDGSTGQYLTEGSIAELSRKEIEQRLRGEHLGPAERRQLQWWHENGYADPLRLPRHGVKPERLDSAGWGVIYGPKVTPDIKKRLSPLIELRKAQAGGLFQEFNYAKQTKTEFLAEQEVRSGPAVPNKVPYYLLLVGDPVSIPYRFQYELDVEYAVGRLHFDGPDALERFGKYATTVKKLASGDLNPPDRQVSLFSVNNHDRATRSTTRRLVRPLFKAIQGYEPSWKTELIEEDDAKKARLNDLLGGGASPRILFAAGHGLRYPADNRAIQLERQGALLCSEWQGSSEAKGPVSEEQYFAARDVGPESLRGMIAFFFTCYGAGTPKFDNFSEESHGGSRRLASSPFLSRLPQELLGHPEGGAVAVLGHIDRAWTNSFLEALVEGGQTQVFESVIQGLIDGQPVGLATEYLNQWHASLAATMSNEWEDFEEGLLESHEKFTRLRRATKDSRNYVLLGDPAVRVG